MNRLLIILSIILALLSSWEGWAFLRGLSSSEDEETDDDSLVHIDVCLF